MLKTSRWVNETDRSQFDQRSDFNFTALVFMFAMSVMYFTDLKSLYPTSYGITWARSVNKDVHWLKINKLRDNNSLYCSFNRYHVITVFFSLANKVTVLDLTLCTSCGGVGRGSFMKTTGMTVRKHCKESKMGVAHALFEQLKQTNKYEQQWQRLL